MVDRCLLTFLFTPLRSLKNNELRLLKFFLLTFTMIPIKIKILDIKPIAIPKKKVISILIPIPNIIMPTCSTSADRVLVIVLSPLILQTEYSIGLSSNLWITDLMVKENVLARWSTQIILFLGKTN